MLSDHVRYLEPIQVTGRLTPERCREHERTARELARSARNSEHRKRLDDIAATVGAALRAIGSLGKASGLGRATNHRT
jgi:hypothetical protein